MKTITVQFVSGMEREFKAVSHAICYSNNVLQIRTSERTVNIVLSNIDFWVVGDK